MVDCRSGIRGGGLAIGVCGLVTNSMPQFGQNTADGGGISPQLGQTEGALVMAGCRLGGDASDGAIVDGSKGCASGMAADSWRLLINSIPQF